MNWEAWIMRKIICCFLIFVSIFSLTGNAEEIVFSSLETSDILRIIGEAKNELASRGEFQELAFGAYRVGLDLPAGRYLITELSNTEKKYENAWWVLIYKEGADVNSFYKSDLAYGLSSNGTVSVTLSEGETLKVEPSEADLSSSTLIIEKVECLFAK